LISLLPPAKAGGILNEWQTQTEALEVKFFSNHKKTVVSNMKQPFLILNFNKPQSQPKS